MNEGYEAYKKYLGIKLHFTKNEYDFFKYNSKTNAKYETFIKRNDKYFFVKAARKYGDNIVDYFVSNIISNKSHYIKDMNNEVYLDRQKRIDGLSYYFERDIEQLLRKSEKDFNKIFNINDVILFSTDANGKYRIEQTPKINGAVIVMDPYSGRVLAMTGGFDFRISSFNRAVQAKRQPGSAFKPFVYLAALEHGFQPNTMILDAPFVIDQGEKLGKWKPENYGKIFYGPSPLRKGIENSRNLMTIRIAQYLGMDKISEIAERTDILNEMPEILSMALGAGETTLLNLTKAYSSFVNGGDKVDPIFIDRIQDRRGTTIYKASLGSCSNCLDIFSETNTKPKLINNKENIFSASHAYQVTSMLKGAVDRGTGKKTSFKGIEIAGKTGTTNNNTDAWFIGYTSDLIIGIYTGFDKPLSLGKKETGSSVAVPIFKDIIQQYLNSNKSLPFRVPNGIELIKTDLDTGKIITNNDSNSIYEAFGINDKISPNSETLIGVEGFKSIQIDEINDDTYLVY